MGATRRTIQAFASAALATVNPPNNNAMIKVFFNMFLLLGRIPQRLKGGMLEAGD
jgi:hypothetical protein